MPQFSRHLVLLTIALRSSAYVEQVLSFLHEYARNDLVFGPKAVACKNKLSSMPRTSRGDIQMELSDDLGFCSNTGLSSH